MRVMCLLAVGLFLVGLLSPVRADSISINWGTDGTGDRDAIFPADGTNMAGVVCLPFWNQIRGEDHGWQAGSQETGTGPDGDIVVTNLISSRGIGTQVSFRMHDTSNKEWFRIRDTDTPGNNNNRLMQCATWTEKNGAIEITVSNLPTSVTEGRYNLIVYMHCRGDGDQHEGMYRFDLDIGANSSTDHTLYAVLDAPDADFLDDTPFDNSGQSEVEEDAGPANYIQFSLVGYKTPDFKLVVDNLAAIGRVTLNGLQIQGVPPVGTVISVY